MFWRKMRGRKKKLIVQKEKVHEDVRSVSNSLERDIQTPFFKVDLFGVEGKDKSNDVEIQTKRQGQLQMRQQDEKHGIVCPIIDSSRKLLYDILFTPEKNKRNRAEEDQVQLTQKRQAIFDKSVKKETEGSFHTFHKPRRDKTLKKKSYEQEIKEQYYDIIQKIKHGLEIQIPKPSFSKYTLKNGYVSQLFTFKPNIKNGRHIRFDEKLKTCLPIFRCQGCLKQFKVASALGGHLSKCGYKKKHEKMINEFYDEYHSKKILKRLDQDISIDYSQQILIKDHYQHFKRQKEKQLDYFDESLDKFDDDFMIKIEDILQQGEPTPQKDETTLKPNTRGYRKEKTIKKRGRQSNKELTDRGRIEERQKEQKEQKEQEQE